MWQQNSALSPPVSPSGIRLHQPGLRVAIIYALPAAGGVASTLFQKLFYFSIDSKELF